MNQRPVLGKGLSSLLPGGAPPAPPTMNAIPEFSASRIPGLTFAPIEDVVPNPYQPRREFSDEELRELSQSIITNGVIQPLIVRKGPYGYQLIAGERRLRAAKMAGLKQVPIVVRKSTDREALEIALVENVQRSDLNCIDEALAYLQLMQEFHLTQDETAERVGKDRSTVANFVRLLRLPKEIIDELKTGRLSFGHGKVLLSLDSAEEQLAARKAILDRQLSVRATEAWIVERKSGSGNSKDTAAESEKTLNPVQVRLKNLATELMHSVGMKTEIKGNGKRGKIVLHYSTREELERLIGLMQTSD